MMKNRVWKEIPNTSSENRFFHTSTLFQDYIITYGGYKTNNLNDIKIFNLKTCSFEDFILKGENPSARQRHSACLFNENKIFLFGGYDGEKIIHGTAIISIEQTTLTKGGKNLVRCSHSAYVHKNRMYTFGGQYKLEPALDSNQLWSLDLKTFNWRHCETQGPKPEERTAHSSALHQNKLYIFGGYSCSQKYNLESSYILCLETMQWENFVMSESNLIARNGAFCASFEDQIFIIGGNLDSNNSTNKALSFNLKKKVLTSTEPQGDYVSSRFGTAVVDNNSLILWGGEPIDSQKGTPKIIRLHLNQNDQEKTCEGKNPSFLKDIKDLLGSEQLADIHFSIEGKRIPAHKLVLSLGCKYFANLFTSKMKESQFSEIEISDVKLATFEAFLQFLYQNEVKLTESLALDLYELSDKYLQSELASWCEDFLSKHLILDNFIAMIEFAEKFEAAILKEAIVDFIANNLEEIKKNQKNYSIPSYYLLEMASKLIDKSNPQFIKMLISSQ